MTKTIAVITAISVPGLGLEQRYQRSRFHLRHGKASWILEFNYMLRISLLRYRASAGAPGEGKHMPRYGEKIDTFLKRRDMPGSVERNFHKLDQVFATITTEAAAVTVGTWQARRKMALSAIQCRQGLDDKIQEITHPDIPRPGTNLESSTMTMNFFAHTWPGGVRNGTVIFQTPTTWTRVICTYCNNKS